MKKVIFLAGPTAVGKTDIALLLAKQLKGEIICADSMQIYKEMSIGTAKPSPDEFLACPHHLFDCVDPRENYSVSEYKDQAVGLIKELLLKDIQPIVAGGTGLYFNALMYQMDFSNQEPDWALRDALQKLAESEGRAALHEKLRALNPEKAEEIHPNNIHRVMRAIEIATHQGGDQQAFLAVNRKIDVYDFKLVVLTRDREDLYDRINRRVHLMVNNGLFEEVEGLIKLGLTAEHQSMKGIGYKEVVQYFQGLLSYDETIALIQQNSRHYAKRQITWFKRYRDAIWVNLSQLNDYNAVIGDIITDI